MLQRFLLGFVIFLLANGNLSAFAADDETADEILAISTISDINRFVNLVSFYAILEINVTTGVVFEDKYLIPFANYLDYNVVGAGRSVYIYPARMANFIAEKINSGTALEDISDLLIQEFKAGKFTVDMQQAASEEDALRVKIGTYLVGEFEYHQEPDGEFLPLLEINQAKIFFSASYKSPNSNANMMGFLAEFNPIPEEVIHQIDEIIFSSDSITDTITYSSPEGDGNIPFERLQFTIKNIGKSGVNLTMGQIRNPFGIWSDFTSHRNFTSTKNNALVGGYALKKIELGLVLDRSFGPLNVMAAVVHGRKGRTYPLFRADDDDKLDAIVRATYNHKGLTIGASGYFAEFGTQRMAVGADILMDIGNLLIGAEFVYQKNDNFSELHPTTADIRTASSIAGYLQADYALFPKLHLFGMYDVWNLNLDGEQFNQPAVKIFHGLRYYLTKNVRWTIVEYGRLMHKGFDNGFTHLSTQLEVTF